MGLDQYLNVTRRESNYNFEVDQRGENEVYNKIIDALSLDKNKLEDTPRLNIEYTPVYWRKANQIHGWFIDNLADGKDECQEIYVPHTALLELSNICKTLLDKKQIDSDAADVLAVRLLPPMEGFFFGTYQIDEWYWGDIQHTYDSLQSVLKDVPDDSWKYTITYKASWQT